MTYGFIEFPYDLNNIKKQLKKDSLTTKNLKDKTSSAFNKAKDSVKNAIQNPSQTLKDLSAYINSNNMKIANTLSNTVNTVTTKFAGIALCQLIKDGKITSKSALDYLFLGFAPALNQQAVALGYSGVTQMKNAMINGTINVGQFINGFSNTCKGIYNTGVANNWIKKITDQPNRLYFDMTLSDGSSYQSETPDRRVESGEDLSEFCHNLPPIFDVHAELQEGKRYTKEEFRSILTTLRDKMQPVILYLGDEHFESVILQNFSPTGQGSQKGGFEYDLQFKKINVGSIEEVVIEQFQEAPKQVSEVSEASSITSITGKSTAKANLGLNYSNSTSSNVSQKKAKGQSALWRATTPEIHNKFITITGKNQTKIIGTLKN